MEVRALDAQGIHQLDDVFVASRTEGGGFCALPVVTAIQGEYSMILSQGARDAGIEPIPLGAARETMDEDDGRATDPQREIVDFNTIRSRKVLVIGS